MKPTCPTVPPAPSGVSDCAGGRLLGVEFVGYDRVSLRNQRFYSRGLAGQFLSARYETSRIPQLLRNAI
jgi:hypothetical protein